MDKAQEKMVMSCRHTAERKWRTAIGVLIILCVCGSGCGPQAKVVGVSGSITLKGVPLTKGTITFEPVDLTVGNMSGAMIESGQYDVPLSNGLKPGKYRVKISSPDPDKRVEIKRARDMGDMGGAITTPAELIPKKYNVESEEVVEVEMSAKNRFDFSIE